MLIYLYAEYIIRNARLDEVQGGIKIAGRNINNLRYADHTTPVTKTEEELKSHLMKMKKESEKVDLKLNIQNTEIMASGPVTSWQIDGEGNGNPLQHSCWKIPWTEEPDRLQSMGSQRVGHN